MRRIGSLAAVVVVSGGLFMFASHDRGDVGPTLAPGEAERIAAPIDPEPFRREIEAAEAILYHPEPPSWETPDQIGAAVMALGAKILQSSYDPRVRGVGAEMLALGGQFSAQSDVGYATPDLVALRRAWETRRNEVFEPAAWFQGEIAAASHSAAATAELDLAQTPAGPVPLTRFEQRQYERMIESLTRLSERGRRKCRDLGEPDYDISVPTERSEKHVARWFAWSREWEDELFSAWKEAPDHPGFAAQTDLLVAYQDLEHALRELQFVPRGAGMWPTPFEGQWNQRFDAAENRLADARERLARVPVE